MKFDEFVKEVVRRARLSSHGEAVGAIRATLATLGQRLQPAEVDDLASQLPREIAHYLRDAKGPERFGLKEFFERVSKLENAELPHAVYHARVVIAVLQDAVTPGEIRDVRDQLPDEFGALFDAGTEGEMPITR